MNISLTGHQRWFAVGALALACGLGFVLARVTGSSAGGATPVGVKPANSATRSSLEVEGSHLAAVGIALEPVAPGSLSAEIRAPAMVMPAANGQATITAHAAGTVTKIDKRLGDAVRAGEPLALVESRDAAAITAARAVAESKADLARSVLARERGLYEQRVTARQDFEAAQAQLIAAEAEVRSARAAAQNAHVSQDGKSVTVTSPLSGRITSASAALGAFVEANTQLFQVADPRFIQIEASVTSLDAARVAQGDPARILLSSGATLAAKVQSATPTVNERTRSATVVLSFDDPTGAPAPGEFVQALITPRQTAPAGFVVPEDAIQRVDGRDVVFVRIEKGFRVQPVVVGARSGGRASVLSGLRAGETIATRNAFLLKAELGKGAAEDEG